MPGVPPDTVAQVKKGLKGLFRRSRSKQPQEAQPTPDTSSKPVPTETTATGAAVSATKQGTANTINAQTKGDSAHHIPEPNQQAEAKDINLDPSQGATDIAKSDDKASSTVVPVPNAEEPKSDAPSPATAAATLENKAELAPIVPPAPAPSDEHGMSATSGPLQDHLAEEFGLGHNEEDATEALGRTGGEGVLSANEKAKLEEEEAAKGVKEGIEPKEGEEEGAKF